MVRKAKITDAKAISEIFEDAKAKFALDKTYQWKGMYPNVNNFYEDLDKEIVIVDEIDGVVCGCATIVLSIDQNYNQIDGKWLNDDKYLSVHRIATKKEYLCCGVAFRLLKEVEKIALSKDIKNIKIDTHKDNKSMQALLNKLEYKLCGEIILLKRDDLKLEERKRIAYQKEL